MAAPMTWPGHVRATLVLGLPLVGAQLAQMLINTTDVVMLGWYGTEQLAAGVLATQAFFLIFMFGGGFAHAVVPIASQAEGRGDSRQVRRSVRMGLWIVTIYGLLVMPLLWNIEPILVAFGQEPDIARMTGSYMHIAQWGMFPALGTLALRSFFSAVSRTQIILWATIAGTLSNGLLNYVFIFGHLGAPEMGLEGAALASLISSTVIFLVMLVWILIRPFFSDYALFQRFWRPDWPDVFEIGRLGFPIAFVSSLLAGGKTMDEIPYWRDGTLEKYAPHVGLLLNLSKDHLEISALKKLFATFKKKSKKGIKTPKEEIEVIKQRLKIAKEIALKYLAKKESKVSKCDDVLL